jgi:phage tail-like protein
VSSAMSNFRPGDRHPASGRSPDPAPGLRFLVKIGTEPIGRFQECTGIQVEYETLEWPEGGENRFVHKLRGRTKYTNIVLKRGITHEKNLVKWFRDCSNRTKRFPVTVELLAGDLKPVRSFSFDMAFPVKWTGPNLNAGQNNAAIETLEIAHQGFAEL